MEHQNNYRNDWLDVIVDSLTNSVSANDEQRLKEWLNESEENAAYFRQIESIWNKMKPSHNPKVFDKEQAFNLFLRRTESAKKTKRFRVLSYAVAIVLLLLIINVGALYYTSQDRMNIAVAEIYTPRGSKMEMCLEDGTRLFLNSNTKLLVDRDFGVRDRKLKLVGEAYLEVAKNKKAPFIVEVNGMDVKVHGTSFYVKAYPNEKELKIALVEGSIELLASSGEQVIVAPNETVTYNLDEKTLTIEERIPSGLVSWRNNQIMFDGEKFTEIVKVLERSFDVDIKLVNDRVKNKSFVGDFMNAQTIDDVLKVMSTNNEFKYEIKGQEVIIY